MKLSAIFIYSLHLLRLLGSFPYTWCVSNFKTAQSLPKKDMLNSWADGETTLDHHQNHVRSSLLRLQKQLFLVIYSWLFVCLETVSGISLIVYFFTHTGDSSSYLIYTVVNTRFCVFTVTTTICINIFLVWKSSVLVHLLNCLDTLLGHIQLSFWELLQGKMMYKIGMYISLPITDVIYIAIEIPRFILTKTNSSFSITEQLVHKIFFSLFVFFYKLILTAIIVIFYSVVICEARIYSRVLPVKLDCLTEPTNAKRKPIVTHAVPHFPVAARGSASLPEAPGMLPQEKTASEFCRLSSEDVMCGADLLCRLHQFQRVFNQYFTLPVTFAMVRSLGVITILTFNLVAYNPTLGTYIYLGFGLLQEIIFVVLLTIAPENVNDQREELRNTIVILRLKNHSDKALGTMLGHLHDLMATYPDFNMGSLFILAKGRLVPMTSFIITYLVILLQFKLGELEQSSNHTNATTNCSCS